MALNYGFKVSQAGGNVLTAADDVLVFSSKFKTLKVFASGNAAVTTDADGNVTSEVTHSLGFAPAFIAIRKTSTVQTKTLDAERPEQSADDTYIDNSNIFNTDNFIRVGNSGYSGGVRFTSVPVPQSATIKYAKIRFWASESQSGNDAKVRIEGEKAINVGAFTTRDNYNSKTSTTAQIAWTMPTMTVDTAYDTPDLTAIVQEIVNQAGFGTSDQSMLFMFKDNGSSSGAFRKFYSWDGSFALYASLYIWYEEAATVSNAYFPNPNNYNDDIESSWDGYAYSDATKLYLRMVSASPNTPYTFKYYIFSDLAESYSGTQGAGAKNYGIKVSADGFDVTTAKPYQLAYSSRFAALKIDNNLVGSGTIVLAALTPGNSQSGTLDITHGLGYPPLFLAFGISNLINTTQKREIPFAWNNNEIGDTQNVRVFAWSDATKVRIKAVRELSGFGSNLAAETFTIKYYIFREDLSLL